MKNRSLKIFTAMLSVLVCFGLLSRAEAGTDLGGGNTANGFNALNSLTTGGFNTADGWFSEAFLTEGFFNTAQGAGSLDVNINGNSNSAFGTAALLLNLGNLADNNTAVGTNALLFNSFTATDPATAVDNTGVGFMALYSNLDGGENTAVGSGALEANTADGNTAFGFNAASSNVGAIHNTAIGHDALTSNTDGGHNMAVGNGNLENLDGGVQNTSLGDLALDNLADGNNNTAAGWLAGSNYSGDESNNIVIGADEGGVGGEDNTIRMGTVGPSAGILVKPQQAGGPLVTNTVLIGTGNHSQGISVTELLGIGTIQIGRGIANAATSTTFIGGIVGFVQPEAGTAEGVTIETNPASVNFQRLGREASSRRYKEDIKPMDKLSEAVFKLKPVTYRIKKEINPAQPTAFGLIAEDVAEANPDLVVYNSEGQPESVHYKQVDVMLLNEFLKEHKKVEEQQARIADLNSRVAKQEATIAQQQKGMEVLTAQLKEQAAQIQKVSAQLEVSKRAPQVVVNKP